MENNKMKERAEKQKRMKKLAVIGCIGALTAAAIAGGAYLLSHSELTQSLLHMTMPGKQQLVPNAARVLSKGAAVRASSGVSVPQAKDVIGCVTVSMEENASDPMFEYAARQIAQGIRNLHEGHHASPEKREMAKLLGIPLGDNQTFWNPFQRQYRVKTV